jgi:UDP-N-acetylglucosamine--N-acetylmuramyl-(pentapeptide) pyrophosphoryl-undecaprenol N-acetylglucosamine transferase
MKIILSGGGTLGPVIPLIAIREIYNRAHPETKWLWVGTRKGPEKEIVLQNNIAFLTIVSGKWRRYFSFWNFIDLFKLIIAFFQSLILLIIEKPALLISAGGFVSVPLHWAGFCLGIPTWIHQQDALPGLANKLMAKPAQKITVALQKSVKYFSVKKTGWIGNPVRDLSARDVYASRQVFGLPLYGPVIFALGGGTGSSKINDLVIESLQSLPADWQIIHLVGRERPSEKALGAVRLFKNYHPYKFFTHEMKDAYAVADIVVARAGFATITELASLSKPAIILPMADTHQEENALMLSKEEAVIVLNENTDNGLKLAKILKDLMDSPNLRRQLGTRLHDILPPAKVEVVVKIIEKLVKN